MHKAVRGGRDDEWQTEKEYETPGAATPRESR
nr:MAG TPA: hypothetical protein [Caudoviricetes sp.]